MRRWALRLLVTTALVVLAAMVSCGVAVSAWLLSSVASSDEFKLGFAIVAAILLAGAALLPALRKE